MTRSSTANSPTRRGRACRHPESRTACVVTGVNSDLQHRPIRSFVLRQGRFSPAQREAYDALLPRFGIPYSPAPIDLAGAFGRPNPKGSGNRLRHGRDDRSHRSAAAGSRFPGDRCARAGRWQPAATDRPRATHATCASSATTPSTSLQRHDRCPARLRQYMYFSPTLGRRSGITSDGCSSRRSCMRLPNASP